MARVAAIGEPMRIYGYGLAGAVIRPASSHSDALRAWRELPADVAVVVLTPRAEGWLVHELPNRPDVLPVVMPDMDATEASTLSAAGQR